MALGSSDDGGADLLAIRAFLVSPRWLGATTTSAFMTHFDLQNKPREEVIRMRALLRSIATLDRSTHKWNIKNEFL